MPERPDLDNLWTHRLPPHLSERVRRAAKAAEPTSLDRGTPAQPKDQSPRPGSLAGPSCRIDRAEGLDASQRTSVAGVLPAFVLYWMRTAVRADENPALDVARYLANEMGCPLLVYHGLSDDYEFASDRHHTFMLEGARDVQSQLRSLGIDYVFHLTTQEDTSPRLLELAAQATCLITEDMPVDPPRRYLQAILRHCDTPTLLVDTACVVPMRSVPLDRAEQPHTRAFRFRDATKREFRRRVGLPWPEITFDVPRFPIEQLSFAGIDLSTACLDECVARCRIDHSVPPVRDTVGGSTAGYERWNRFITGGLRSYDRRRNQPLIREGVSRLSAYLHYGMVSPFRIAREAAAISGSGSEKFLDELWVWRELAYHFCFQREDHGTWEALPDWARASLEQHRTDLRPALYSWETLTRGDTNDPLWNAAQHSLRLNGELHNNVRMTWGKAFLDWTATPQEALALMIDLNHRFALDGRDPASYGGLLWCLGQFDRPFEPEQPILGLVRPRPTKDHAKRLPPDVYEAQVKSAQVFAAKRVAVVGAGIAGLIAARTLADQGMNVQVFEKSRGVAGRMSTRHADQELTFDHGAQYFTVRDQRFRNHVNSWQQQGLVQAWPKDQPIVVLSNGSITKESNSIDRYVGVPKMTAIGRHLAQDLAVMLETRVTRLERRDSETCLYNENNECLGVFDWVIVAIPSPQAAELLAEAPELAESLGRLPMHPCWATMVSLPTALPAAWAGAFAHDSPLAWIARNQTKPGRPQHTEALVLHATPAWTSQHWDSPPDVVGQRLLEAFWAVSGLPQQTPTLVQSHRWRYALPESVQVQLDGSSDTLEYLTDRTGAWVACGDACAGGRVEGAFLSGMAAAGHVLRRRELVPQTDSVQLTLF